VRHFVLIWAGYEHGAPLGVFPDLERALEAYSSCDAQTHYGPGDHYEVWEFTDGLFPKMNNGCPLTNDKIDSGSRTHVVFEGPCRWESLSESPEAKKILSRSRKKR